MKAQHEWHFLHNKKLGEWGWACSCGKSEFGYASREAAGWLASGHDLDNADEPAAGDKVVALRVQKTGD